MPSIPWSENPEAFLRVPALAPQRHPPPKEHDWVWWVAAHLVAIMQGGHDLSEEMPGVPLTQPWPLADVIVQIASAGILHDNHNLAAVLKHWRGQARMSGLPENMAPTSPQIGRPRGMSATGDSRAAGQANKGRRAYEEELRACLEKQTKT